jgi:hypothetical protein
MALLIGRDMRAMEPTELLFWGVMSLGAMAGFALAYPLNVWMVSRQMKHGLMTDREEKEKKQSPTKDTNRQQPKAHDAHSHHGPDPATAGHSRSVDLMATGQAVSIDVSWVGRECGVLDLVLHERPLDRQDLPHQAHPARCGPGFRQGGLQHRPVAR